MIVRLERQVVEFRGNTSRFVCNVSSSSLRLFSYVASGLVTLCRMFLSRAQAPRIVVPWNEARRGWRMSEAIIRNLRYHYLTVLRQCSELKLSSPPALTSYGMLGQPVLLYCLSWRTLQGCCSFNELRVIEVSIPAFHDREASKNAASRGARNEVHQICAS
jgi:hypothetical protein